jgi:hypothetical protein
MGRCGRSLPAVVDTLFWLDRPALSAPPSALACAVKLSEGREPFFSQALLVESTLTRICSQLIPMTSPLNCDRSCPWPSTSVTVRAGVSRGLSPRSRRESPAPEERQAHKSSHVHCPLLPLRIHARFHRSAIRVTSVSAARIASSGLDCPVTTLMNMRGMTKLLNTSIPTGFA